MTPFTDPCPPRTPPYYLRGPDPQNEALHRRLLAAAEARARAATAPATAPPRPT